MATSIGSWNACNGITCKKDYIRGVLHEENLDILCIQEAQLTDENEHLAQLDGFNSELSNCTPKKRSMIFVKKSIHYTRLVAYEDPRIELVVIKTNEEIICNFYRPFLLPLNVTAIDYMNITMDLLKKLIESNRNEKIILVGDFNLDFNKINDNTYRLHTIYDSWHNFYSTFQMIQVQKECSWRRIINASVVESVLDHVYVTNKCLYTIRLLSMDYGDHELVKIDCLKRKYLQKRNNEKIQIRNWKNYNKNFACELLKNYNLTNFGTLNVQDSYNLLEKTLLEVLDKLAPFENFNQKETNVSWSPEILKLVRHRRNVYKKAKKKKSVELFKLSKQLNKQILKKT